MNLTLHLIRRDVHRVRHLLILWLVLLIAPYILNLFVPKLSETWMFGLSSLLLPLIPLLHWLILLVIVPLVVQGDPIRDNSAFWLTKPISRGRLLVAKLLFVTGLLLIMALAAGLALLAYGSPFGQALLAIPEVVIREGGFLLLVFTLAAITRDFSHFAVLGVILLVVNFIVAFTVLSATRALDEEGGGSDFSKIQLFKSSIIGVSVLGVLCYGAILTFLYQTRRRSLAFAALVVVFLLLPVVRSLWSWNFFPPAISSAAVTDPPRLEGFSMEREPKIADELIVSGRLLWPGLPATGFGDARFSSVKLTDGSSRISTATMSHYEYAADEDFPHLQKILGDIRLLNAKSTGPSLPMFRLSEKTFLESQGKPLQLTGKMRVRAMEYVNFATLPVRSGAVWRDGANCIQIQEAGIFQRSVSIRMYVRSVQFLLDGQGRMSRIIGDIIGKSPIVYVLVNPTRREAIAERPFFGFGDESLIRSSFEGVFIPLEGQKIDDAWLAQAELRCYELRADEALKPAPFSFPDFRLPELPPPVARP